uniref:Uncharacterized protein n=1 Tax=Rhizophora mucronata TaxID=61149 RepID=A0A2P2R443_RHIMU
MAIITSGIPQEALSYVPFSSDFYIVDCACWSASIHQNAWNFIWEERQRR